SLMWVAGLALLLFAACGSASHGETPERVRGLSFQSSGYRLEGTLTRPENRTANAGILIVGGSGPINRDGIGRIETATPPIYRWWADDLGAAGFAVFRYDKRFVTYPRIDVAAFDQEAQIDDAMAALAALRASPEVAGHDVYIIGHSEGGMLAPIVATRAGAVAGVILVNTVVFPVDELLVAQLDANPGVPKTVVAEARRGLDAIKAGSFPPGGVLFGAGAGYWAQWIQD